MTAGLSKVMSPCSRARALLCANRVTTEHQRARPAPTPKNCAHEPPHADNMCGDGGRRCASACSAGRRHRSTAVSEDTPSANPAPHALLPPAAGGGVEMLPLVYMRLPVTDNLVKANAGSSKPAS